MKPVPAIVEPAPIDVDEIAEQVIAALGAHRQAERSIAILETEIANARGAAKMRRIEIGLLLAKVRGAWATSGPKARGWGDFLARVKLDDSTAHRYVQEAKDPGGFSQRREETPDTPAADDDDQTGPRIIPADRPTAPFRQPSKEDVAQAMARLSAEDRKWVLKSGKANLQGNSGDVERGTWTTSKKWAEAIGPVDHDPFSNPRSLIASTTRCMLEDGGDGFGGGEPGETPGLYLLGERHGSRTGVATSDTTTFFQWPYTPGFAERAIAHYRHTRFRALLRWSPDTTWFRMLWPLVSTIAIPQERIEFDPPPGIPRPESTISYPHALYYANWRDVTDEVRALCIVIPIDHATTDPRAIQPAAGL